MPFNLSIDSSWTLFLDRDGVLNERIIGGYVQTPEALHLLPGVPEALVIFSRYFGRIVVVTNQQGIGKGLYTAEDLARVHEKMDRLITEANGRIDCFYHAPNLAAEQSPNRKPGPGMAHQAQRDFPEIDFQKSVMVGDSPSDMEFGMQLGMKTAFITTPAEERAAADYHYPSLHDLALEIEAHGMKGAL